MRREKEELRFVDQAMLRDQIRRLGLRGKEKAAVGIDCSASLIEKMLTQKERQAPHKRFRQRFCEFFGIDEDQLFPLADETVGEPINEEHA